MNMFLEGRGSGSMPFFSVRALLAADQLLTVINCTRRNGGRREMFSVRVLVDLGWTTHERGETEAEVAFLCGTSKVATTEA